MINLNKLAKEVIRLAKERPEHKYLSINGRCYYTFSHGGCIIGQALVNLYPELKWKLEKADRDNQVSSFDNLMNDWNIAYEGDEHLIPYLARVQELQDARRTWGEALEKSGLEKYIQLEIKSLDLAKEIIRLARENPDYIYHSNGDSCYYTKPNGGCIIGQALTNLYPELKLLLKEIDSRNAITVSMLFSTLKVDNTIPTSYFSDIQHNQDMEESWIQSVELSDIVWEVRQHEPQYV